MCAAVDPILGFTGAHAFLSNKFELSTTITLMVGSFVVAANNSEALFQCQKKPNEADRFSGLNFWDSKGLGDNLRMSASDLSVWDTTGRVEAMLRSLRAKFRLTMTTGTLALQLLDTGSALLVHVNEHNDTFWGCNSRKKGKDRLGKMLMQTRKELGEQARADNNRTALRVVARADAREQRAALQARSIEQKAEEDSFAHFLDGDDKDASSSANVSPHVSN